MQDIHIITFKINNTQYGIDIKQIQEVIKIPEKITKLYKCRNHVIGIFNIRNKIIPLIDLKFILTEEIYKLSTDSRVIIVENNGKFIGFLVDEISQVLNKNDVEIDNCNNELSKGFIHISEELICLIDIDKLFLEICESKGDIICY